jgi:hypothetical protein
MRHLRAKRRKMRKGWQLPAKLSLSRVLIGYPWLDRTMRMLSIHEHRAQSRNRLLNTLSEQSRRKRKGT